MQTAVIFGIVFTIASAAALARTARLTAIVVLIMGIMAAVAVPSFSHSLCRFRVEATAKRIAADLMRACQHATATEATQQVAFYLLTNSYNLPGYMDPDHPSIEYEVYLSKTGHPAKLVSCDFGGDSFVTFDMYGKPQNAGTVVVQSGNYQKTVRVDATTGKVTIE
jgi:type II secretory pathway pseudopilin PulG